MEFKNVLFEYNSLIELNSVGGYVVISKSKFDRLSSCGAIIRNFKATYDPGELATNDLPDQYLWRANKVQG